MQIGDVYDTFFSNEPPQPGGKDRPALFLGYRNGKATMVMLKVTGTPNRKRRVEILKPLTGGVGLSKTSYVQCDWYLPVPSETVLGQYYGLMDPSDLFRVIKKFNTYNK